MILRLFLTIFCLIVVLILAVLVCLILFLVRQPGYPNFEYKEPDTDEEDKYPTLPGLSARNQAAGQSRLHDPEASEEDPVVVEEIRKCLAQLSGIKPSNSLKRSSR